MNVGSFVGSGCTLDKHDARALLHAVENNFAAIGRHIEIANDKVCRQFSQLTLDTGLRIQLPEFLRSMPPRRNTKDPDSRANATRRAPRVRIRPGKL